MSQSQADHTTNSQTPVSKPGHRTIQDDCDRFEEAWKSGVQPKIEEFLQGWDEPEFTKLLCELIQLDLHYASSAGHTLTPHIYLSRFPQHVNEVSRTFNQWEVDRPGETSSSSSDTVMMQTTFGELQEHARGGLGVVYRAGDQILQRLVAVKVIGGSQPTTSVDHERFRTEASITSQLEHPGVVPVYGFGQLPDNRPFYAMRFIVGPTLQDAIDRVHHRASLKGAKSNPDLEREKILAQFTSVTDLLDRFVDVCDTLAYSHKRRIVHRDLKPQNVMLGNYGETLVVDWGLAIQVDLQGTHAENRLPSLKWSSGSNPSGPSGVAGTPAYMSPEQANVKELAPSSDVYSLGVILYTILVGDIPFTGAANVHEILDRVRKGKFQHPRQVNSQVPAALEAICLKAMALDPDARYSTPTHLKDDVKRYLADTKVEAYAEPFWSTWFRWMRRHLWLTTAAIVVLALLTVAGFVSRASIARSRASDKIAFEEKRLRHEGEQKAREKELKEEQARLKNVEAQRDKDRKQLEKEQALRSESLIRSAELATARLENFINYRMTILQREAEAIQFREFLGSINQVESKEAASQPLQQWVEDRIAKEYSEIKPYSWTVFAKDGTQVVRVPRDQENMPGVPHTSLFKNYWYRDYFHGKNEDFVDDPETDGVIARFGPLKKPKISVAMWSTSDELLMMISVPILDSANKSPVGVMSMAIRLGDLAESTIALPQGQKLSFVDTRPYFMVGPKRNRTTVSGQGLVLISEDDDKSETKVVPKSTQEKLDSIPHVSDSVRHCLNEITARLDSGTITADAVGKLTFDRSGKPILGKQEGPKLTIKPVLLSGKADGNTKCFVIVEQVQ